jgi:hypothetical protein
MVAGQRATLQQEMRNAVAKAKKDIEEEYYDDSELDVEANRRVTDEKAKWEKDRDNRYVSKQIHSQQLRDARKEPKSTSNSAYKALQQENEELAKKLADAVKANAEATHRHPTIQPQDNAITHIMAMATQNAQSLLLSKALDQKVTALPALNGFGLNDSAATKLPKATTALETAAAKLEMTVDMLKILCNTVEKAEALLERCRKRDAKFFTMGEELAFELMHT